MESNYVCSNSDAIERNGSVYRALAPGNYVISVLFLWLLPCPALVISLLLEIVSNAKHKMVSKKNCDITVCCIVGSHQYPVSQKGFSKRATNLFWI